MAKSKLEREIEAWREARDGSERKVVLRIVERVFNNADIALRQRNQTQIMVTIAADLDEHLIGKNLKKAKAAYDRAALEMRRLGARVQMFTSLEPIAQMEFESIKAIIDLQGVDLKKIQRKLYEARVQLHKR